MNWFLLNLSPFCSGISVSAMREDRGWFLSRACEKKNPSLIFNDDRKIPTRWSNVPVGNKACRVSHWSGGPEGWHFGTSWRQRHVSAVLYIATLIPHGQRLFHMGTDIGSILPLTRKHRDLRHCMHEYVRNGTAHTGRCRHDVPNHCRIASGFYAWGVRLWNGDSNFQTLVKSLFVNKNITRDYALS